MRFMVFTLILAAWLFVSAFLLPHTPFSRLATWVVASLVVACALLASDRPRARFAICAAAVALALVALVGSGLSAATVANNLVFAAVLLVISLAQPRAVTAKPG
jgi:hypothetical protein